MWSGLALLALGGVAAAALGGGFRTSGNALLVVSGSELPPAGCTTTFSITGPGASAVDSEVVDAAREALVSIDIRSLDLVAARELIVAERRYDDFEEVDRQQQDLLVRHEAVGEAISEALASRGFGTEGYELLAGASCP